MARRPHPIYSVSVLFLLQVSTPFPQPECCVFRNSLQCADPTESLNLASSNWKSQTSLSNRGNSHHSTANRLPEPPSTPISQIQKTDPFSSGELTVLLLLQTFHTSCLPTIRDSLSLFHCFGVQQHYFCDPDISGIIPFHFFASAASHHGETSSRFGDCVIEQVVIQWFRHHVHTVRFIAALIPTIRAELNRYLRWR